MPQKETDYSAKIIAELKKDRGVYIFKFVQSGFSRIGVPDIIVCYKGHFIGIEVKMLGNDYTDQQVYNAVCIERAGGIALGVYVAPKSKGAEYALDMKPSISQTETERAPLEYGTLSELVQKIKNLNTLN